LSRIPLTTVKPGPAGRNRHHDQPAVMATTATTQRNLATRRGRLLARDGPRETLSRTPSGLAVGFGLESCPATRGGFTPRTRGVRERWVPRPRPVAVPRALRTRTRLGVHPARRAVWVGAPVQPRSPLSLCPLCATCIWCGVSLVWRMTLRGMQRRSRWVLSSGGP
jgi:hypothetical protein